MNVFRKYLLYQIPGWVLAAIILWALYTWTQLPLWAAAALYFGYVLKDFLLYPYLCRAYEAPGPTGPDRFVGETGIVVQRLDPAGYVRVSGELWRAETTGDSGALEEGAEVRIQSVRGLTLIVVPCSNAGAGLPGPAV